MITDFAKMLSKFFVQYLSQTKNVSSNTILSYRESFTRFIEFMTTEKGAKAENISLEQFNRSNVRDFAEWLGRKYNNTPSTVNSRIAALRSFANMLQYERPDKIEQWQSIILLSQMKGESKSINYLLPEGVKAILSQPNRNTREGRRHFTILSLMYDSGCRVQEISDLTIGDLRLACKPYSMKVRGKGRKERIIPVSEDVAEIIKQYITENLLEEGVVSDIPLFSNCHNQKLTRAGLTYILKKYVEMARLEKPDLIPFKVSCHSLRHSKAMYLLMAGVNLVYIRDILGHQSITTTQIYARADGRLKREALEKASQKLNIESKVDPLWLKDKNILDWLKTLG